MSCVYFAAILTILPPVYFILWARAGPVRARKYVVVWHKRAGLGSFMLASGGQGCKTAGLCHLYVALKKAANESIPNSPLCK